MSSESPRPQRQHRYIIAFFCLVATRFFLSDEEGEGKLEIEQTRRNLPFEYEPRLVENAPKSCSPYKDDYPEMSLHSSSCPRAVCIPSAHAGLGHRLANVMQGKLVALSLGVPLAGPRLTEKTSHHGDYKGADDLFRIDEEVVSCPARMAPNEYPKDGPHPDPEAAASGWKVARLPTDLPTIRNFLPYGNAVGDGCEHLLKLRSYVAETPCHTVFVGHEYWPDTYFKEGHETIRDIYHGDDPDVVAKLMTNATDWKVDRSKAFNIAVHFRTGDLMLTPAEYFPKVIHTILETMKLAEGISDIFSLIPINIIVFSEYPEKIVPKLKDAFLEYSNIEVIGEGQELGPLQTLLNLMSADIFLGSESSFSWTVNYIAADPERTRPVAVTAPSSRICRGYSGNNIIANLDGSIGHGDQLAAAQEAIVTVAREWVEEHEANRYMPIFGGKNYFWFLGGIFFARIFTRIFRKSVNSKKQASISK